MLTMSTTFAFSMYMLFAPAHALYSLMQLTKLSTMYKFFIALLAFVGFVASYVGEKWLFSWLAKAIGHWKNSGVDGNGKRKQKEGRKRYKLIMES